MDEARARELLTQARAEVENELAKLRQLERDERQTEELSDENADLGTDLFEEELDEGIDETLAAKLEAIKRAERRLREGTYGVSIESGVQIPDGRLEVAPWAERTADEEERYRNLRAAGD